jgi:succinate-semialdehyde dehydrogenase/glutarate-semialdehyde dehydrogenase
METPACWFLRSLLDLASSSHRGTFLSQHERSPRHSCRLHNVREAGSAVTEALIAGPRLRKLSFTGSTEVGRNLLAAVSQTVLRTSMELGGNAPFLIFDDADVDAAVAGALAAKLRNIGEACAAANRFFVQESIAPEFSRRLVEKMAEMSIARGTEGGTQLGALIESASRDKVQSLVDYAVSRVVTVLTGVRGVESRVGFRLLTGQIDTTTPAGRVFFNINEPK